MACSSYEDSFNRNLNSTGLYVANSGSGTISQFAADPKGGTLASLGAIAAGTTPNYVTVNPAGTFAYTVNSGSNDIYVYSIDKTSRKLTYKSSATAGTNPLMIAFHSTGFFAYVINSTSQNITAYTVDSSTGALTFVANTTTTSTPSTLSIHEDKIFVAISDANEIRYFTINTSTGAITASTMGTPAAPNTHVVAYGTSGNPYVFATLPTGQVARTQFTSWPAGFTYTAAGTTPVGLAFNTAKTRAIVGNYGGANFSIYSVANGVLTAAGTSSGCTNAMQIFIGSSDFVYVACRGDNTVNAYSLDSASATLIGSYGVGTTPTSVGGF